MKDWLEIFWKIVALLKLPQTPWLAVVALLLYFSRKKLETWWNSVLDQFGASVGGRWSNRRFEPRYRELCRADHLHMKVVGIRTEEERRPTISEAYVPIRLVPKDSGIENYISVDDAAQDNRYSLILGDPGAGKSTILDYLVCRRTEPTNRPPLAIRLASYLLPLRLSPIDAFPIYVPLRRCLSKHATLLEDILDVETKILSMAIRQQMPRKFIEQSLESGRVVLLLDGLDEVADEEAYRSVASKINDAKNMWPGRIVVTCRKAGWRGGLDQDFRAFTALPLDTQQQYDFVHRWYAAIIQYKAYGTSRAAEESTAHAAREADKLVALLRSKERLREVGSNPLLLSLICLVHHRKKDLPRGRAALYEECVEILVDLWDRIDKDFDQRFPSTDQKKSLLRRIAHYMHTTGMREIKRDELETLTLRFLPAVKTNEQAADIIRQLEVRSGLMVERSIDVLTFSHLTFQEFLVVAYFETEPGAEFRPDRVTDWSTWREPVLLMYGAGRESYSRLKQLFELQPVLAIEAIAELDPAFINADTQSLVSHAIEESEAGRIDAIELTPPLVGLLSLEGNPFGDRIISFLETVAERSKGKHYANLIEVLTKTPTQEAAQILIKMLSKPALQAGRESLFAGLDRIGDAAVYEALDWNRRGDMGDELLFEVLSHVMAPAATQALWRRYGVQPASEMEFEWAVTWARRLCQADHVQMMRRITLSWPGVSNEAVWPYRLNDTSALAAIAQKAVDTLSQRFPGGIELLSEIEVLSQFSLLIQTPLYVRQVLTSSSKDWKALAERILPKKVPTGEREAEYVTLISRRLAFKDLAPLKYSELENRMRQVFKAHAWRSLGGFLARQTQSRAMSVRKALQIIGVFVEIIAIGLVTLGVRASLPPDGTYAGFFLWLPFWARVAGVGIPFVVLPLVFAFAAEELIAFFVGMVLMATLLLAPLLWVFAFYWSEGREVVERSLSFRRMPWGSLIVGLLIAPVVGIVGSFAIVGGFVFPPPTYSLWITLLIMIGLGLQCAARSFESNPLADWLHEHPRGDEVLSEFASSGRVPFTAVGAVRSGAKSAASV